MRSNAKALLCLATTIGILSCQSPPLPSEAVSLNAMSFNIRFDNPNDGDNVWMNRKALVAQTIQFHQADLVGLQEALKNQLDDLTALMPDYAWLGNGRDDGHEKGEYSAILYLKSRFELLHSGTFWLSETPETAGSIGWDAAITRIVTWAHFKDRYSNKMFYFFNTHFDHVGERARAESAKLLLQEIQRLAKPQSLILAGDFNASENSPAYHTLMNGGPIEGTQIKAGLLFDTSKASKLPHFGPKYTFHGFGQAAERTRIDHIFVSHNFRVLRHAALADPCDGRFASDHLPVLAEVVLDREIE